MVEKKKETKVKHREIAQKEDLQELQENMADFNKDNEKKSEEIRTEEPNVVEGMVECKHCKKEVEPFF